MKVIELDHNASTPVDPRVLERFLEVEAACPANPGSPHAGGRRARAALEDARARAADALGVQPDDLVFVGSGTEANNAAVAGLGDPDLPVLLADLEHKSVLAPALRRGVARWRVDRSGRAVVTDPGRPVGLVCIAHGQGEVGSLQPIAEASELATRLGVPLHIDAAQTLGRVGLHEALAKADSLTLSAHKIGGLRGASAWVVRGQRPRPLMAGGGQEGGLRPGTPSPALAAATALAVELAVTEQIERAAAMAAALGAFVERLTTAIDTVLLTPEDALPNTATFMFEGVEGRAILPALDLAGVHASQGSACSAGAPESPAVLRAMGLREDDARRCVRFATSWRTSPEDARNGGERVVSVISRLRGVDRR